MFRKAILLEAINLVGNRGDIRDYQCSCPPGGERFLVTWQDAKCPACYNLEELKAEMNKVLTGQTP